MSVVDAAYQTGQKLSRLLALPEELQLKIFKYVCFHLEFVSYANFNRIKADQFFNLLCTSRNVGRIAQEAFHRVNHFLMGYRVRVDSSHILELLRIEEEFWAASSVHYSPRLSNVWITHLKVQLLLQSTEENGSATILQDKNWRFLVGLARGTFGFDNLQEVQLYIHLEFYLRTKHELEQLKEILSSANLRIKTNKLGVDIERSTFRDAMVARFYPEYSEVMGKVCTIMYNSVSIMADLGRVTG